MRALNNLVKDTIYRITIERLLQSNKFIDDNTYCPHISFAIVRLSKTHLRRHKVRGATYGIGQGAKSFHLLRNTKVTYLENIVPCEKDILSFDISMENILGMHGHNSKSNLSKIP